MVNIEDKQYTVQKLNEITGLTTCTEKSDMLSLNYSLHDALSKAFEETQSCFLTIGCSSSSKSPAYTSAIFKKENNYLSFDSHGRSKKGLCTPNGTAVLMQASCLDELVLFIKNLATSLKSTSFEIVPVKC